MSSRIEKREREVGGGRRAEEMKKRRKEGKAGREKQAITEKAVFANLVC